MKKRKNLLPCISGEKGGYSIKAGSETDLKLLMSVEQNLDITKNLKLLIINILNNSGNQIYLSCSIYSISSTR